MSQKNTKTNKNIFWLFFFVWLIFPTRNVSARVYSPSDYVSLYTYPQTISYKDSSNVDTYQQRTGYSYLYNLDDPTIRCKQEKGACSYEKQYFQYCRVNSELTRFKVYIPPGSTSASLNTYLQGQSPQYVAVIRLGEPPQGDYDNYVSTLSEQDYLGLTTTGFSQEQMLRGDCIGRNHAGIFSLGGGVMTVNSETNGGWLYVLMLQASGNNGSIIGNQMTNYVNSNSFMDWFRSKNWESNGDPAETTVALPSTSLLGDLDQDRKVDIFDYSLFLTEFDKTITGNIADLDKNGKVDIFDYNILLGNFGKSGREE